MRARILAPLAPATTMLLLAGCAGSGTPPVGTAPPMRLVAYDDCAELLGGLRGATAQQVGPYGLPGAVPYGAALEGMAREKATAPDAAAAARPPGGGAAPEHSGTNTHEPGADEPDQVKTDGHRIVALARGRLQVIDPATRKVAHGLDLPDGAGGGPGAGRLLPGGGGDSQLLLSGDRALVLTPENPIMTYARPAPGPDGEVAPLPRPSGPRTRMTLVDLAGTPKVTGTMTTESSYVDARQSGGVARVVIRSTPQIDFPAPARGRNPDPAEAVERNREAVRKAPLEAWLPAFRVSGTGGPEQTYKVPCGKVSRPATYTGGSMLTVLTLDLSRGLGDPAAVSVAGDGKTVYGTGSSLYITGNPPRRSRWNEPQGAARPVEERTDVHKFDVSGSGAPRYVASGSVPGDLLNQYSLSEHDGNLRVATTTTATTPSTTGPDTRPDTPTSSGGGASSAVPRSQSAVHVLAQRGGRLASIGKIDGLGKGERIHSVRYIGTTAYVVTFRRTDPLYVLDLGDPARPRVTGELKINGYSAYLHPTADGRLLGVGQDADSDGRVQGTQVSLFDVSAAPRRVGAYKLPESSAKAEFDPHAFLYWPKTGLTVLPVTRHRGTVANEALILRVDGSGVHRVGSVRHPGEDYGDSIRRSLIVGDTLWTFSDQGARAADQATLKERAWLAF